MGRGWIRDIYNFCSLWGFLISFLYLFFVG